MVKEAYVSFEVAKLLKEKGFDGKCRYYYPDGHTQLISYVDCVQSQMFGNDACIAPTQQMAMAWLREVHHIYIEICLYKTDKNDIEPKKSRKAPYYTFGVWNTITGDNIDKRLTNDFIGDTYEEATEAALKYCLKNLI